MSFLSQVPELKYALGLSGMLSFYGVVSLIVWLIPGDKFGNTEKIVTIVLILLTMPIVLVISLVASRRKKKQEALEKAEREAAEAGDAAPQKLNKSVAAPDDISQAAEETVQFLKSSNLGAGKEAVYELPWYLVIGSPKSGKSSLSLASGLNFQTLPSQRQSELKFVRPTRDVDWRVTSEAVFLDTAGRYQLEGGDEDEWSGLIETIKKYRPNRPLDGMLVSVNAERILHSDDHEIEQIAKVLRGRIDEVTQRTKIRFPIYLIFTHADSIEGFRDSFSTSQKEGKNLVWGATIPLEKSDNAHTLFDSEFDLLQTSIMKRRLMRLSAPFPPVRQLKIFNFPIHFGAARKKLGNFVTNLFRPNPFSENPFLRGFYFTAVPVNRAGRSEGGQTMVNAGQTIGLSYFTEKLFRDVILRDKDLVATFQAQKVGPPIMGWLLTFLGAILTFALLAASAYSLYQNKVMVEKASRHGADVLSAIRSDRERNPLAKNPEETKAELDRIERLRESLEDLDRYEREGAPYLMRLGFYSGNRIYRDKLLPIYYNAIEQRFKKPVLKKLEDELRSFSASQATQDEATLEKNYNNLKAYLMFSGQYGKQSEATFLSTKLSDLWKTEGKVPDGYELKAQAQLEFYAKQVDRFDERALTSSDYIQPSDFPRINLEETNTKGLVDSSRKKLQAYPAVFRYYNRVITKISQERKEEAVSAEKILRGRSEGALNSSYTIPAAYTYDAYHKDFKEAVSKAQEELSKDDWVMGEKAQDQTVDLQKLEKKYLDDYTDNWQKFVRSINVPKFNNKEEAEKALTAFSSENSPMKIILEEISKQTNLSAEKPVKCCSLEYFYSFFTSKTGGDGKKTTTVDQAFNPLFEFTASKGDKEQSQVSQYGKEIKRVSDIVAGKDFDPKTAGDELVNQKSSKFYDALDKAEKGVNTKAEGFSGTTAGQDIAELLKRPLNNLRTWLGAGVQDTIVKTWNDQILPAAKKAEKGYPFDNEGEADLNELTKYLASGGTLSKFYDERLKKYFEEVDGQLKVKEGNDVKFSDDFVKYLNNAFRLREALFGKNPTASFGYELKLQKATDTMIEMTIDGQKIDTGGTGSTKLTFPASSGETGAFLKSSSTAEPTTTAASPATPTPAAPANSNTGSSNSTTSPPPADKPKPKPSSSGPSGSGDFAYPGTWGLFRFFDAGKPGSKNANGEYTLTYNVGGKNVTVIIKPPANADLFDRNIFTSSRAPQTMMK